MFPLSARRCWRKRNRSARGLKCCSPEFVDIDKMLNTFLWRNNLCQSPATKASHVAIICLSSKLCSTASFCTRAIPSLGRQMRTVLFHKAQGRCQPVVPVSSGGFSIPSKHSHDRFTRHDGEKTSHNLNPPTNQDDAGHCTGRLWSLTRASQLMTMTL